MHSSNSSSNSSFAASSDSNQVNSTWNKSLNSRGMFASVDKTRFGTYQNLGSIRDGGYIRDAPSFSPYDVSSASTYKPNPYRGLAYSGNPSSARQFMDRSANTSVGSSCVQGLFHPRMAAENMSSGFSYLRAQTENSRIPSVECQDHKRQRTEYTSPVDQQKIPILQASENEQRSLRNHHMLVPRNLRESIAERKGQQEARRILKPGDPRQEHYDRTHRNDVSTSATVGSSPIHDIWGDVGNLIKGYNKIHKADFYRERAKRIEEQKDMFAKKKLSLVLDLHTLLHHATILDLGNVSNYEKVTNKEERDCKRPLRHLYRFSEPSVWIKLRPGIWNFLEKASQLYELHLFTTWNKKLAADFEKEIDPSGALFGGRIICVDEPSNNVFFWNNTTKRVHNNLDEVKGLESAIIIIDIFEDAWPRNKHNLVLVERYTYFPSKELHRRHKVQSLLECDLDEREEDGTLASTLAVLERIHHTFFDEPCLEKMDVRKVLVAEKKKILAGCRIMFSGLFGLHKAKAKPQKYDHLWQLAEQFGAVCTTKMDSEVTHVVAFIGKTNKVKMALAEGKYVVSRRWIEASSLLYRRAKETDYPFDFVTKHLFYPKLKYNSN
ncbi:Rna polymerase ii c-terminal domain phosphatase-like [Thalictrum thalictroides]|uniref:protein-serine/threonine phosphatase n=1 Tax=Thalictrum thalictroides TaxID=46969 RepID=A0A7J6X780_THATH|nr:Rna polymerase ii c-terminal domain phosphatase-like [Thalictrum thalictroides]